MMNDDKILEAVEFAGHAHLGQTRKVTGEPYIFHPVEVGQIIFTITKNVPATIAAILHDTVEDTDVTEQNVIDNFGTEVADLVMKVTKVSSGSKESRAIRKEQDRIHYSSGSMLSQSIKLADVISNLGDIKTQKHGFVRVYVPEQTALVASLTKGHPTLIDIANRVVVAANEYMNTLD